MHEVRERIHKMGDCNIKMNKVKENEWECVNVVEYDGYLI